MDFSLSMEQEQLRTSVGDWLEDTLGAERIAQLADGEIGWDPASWRQVVDFGLLEADVLTTLDLALISEQLGHGLYPGPLASCIQALPLLPKPAANQVSNGTLRASVAWAADPLHLTLSPDGLLTGEVRHVNDLGAIDALVVPFSPTRFATVSLTAEGVEVFIRETTDRTRRRGDVVLDEVAVEIVELPAEAAEQARLRWLIFLAAESVGAAQRALEITRDYVSERQQFGRVIGTYQAVSHRVADIYTRTELSRSLVYWAAAALDAHSIDAEDAAHAAKAFACQSALTSLEEAIQAHGGVGFTWEHILHRYYKRVRANAASGGNAQAHRALLAEALFA